MGDIQMISIAVLEDEDEFAKTLMDIFINIVLK